MRLLEDAEGAQSTVVRGDVWMHALMGSESQR